MNNIPSLGAQLTGIAEEVRTNPLKAAGLLMLAILGIVPMPGCQNPDPALPEIPTHYGEEWVVELDYAYPSFRACTASRVTPIGLVQIQQVAWRDNQKTAGRQRLTITAEEFLWVRNRVGVLFDIERGGSRDAHFSYGDVKDGVLDVVLDPAITTSLAKGNSLDLTVVQRRLGRKRLSKNLELAGTSDMLVTLEACATR